MNFDRQYSKKDARAILGLTVNEINKWAAMISVAPTDKKTGGRGRPTHMLSIDDLYMLAIFKNLKETGLDRATIAQFIEAIDQRAAVEIIKYAESSGIISALIVNDVLWDILAENADSKIVEFERVKAMIYAKLDEHVPNGGIFFVFYKWGPRDGGDWPLVGCYPVVDPVEGHSIPPGTNHIYGVMSRLKNDESAIFLNVGKIVAFTKYRIEMFYDEVPFWERNYEEIGWDFIGEVNK